MLKIEELGRDKVWQYMTWQDIKNLAGFGKTWQYMAR